MNFENTRDNLVDLEKGESPVSSAEMFRLFGIIMEDVRSRNQGLGQEEMVPGDDVGLVVAVRYILEEALKTLKRNQEAIQQLSRRSQEECRRLIAQAEEDKKCLDGVQNELAKEEQRKAELEGQSKALSAKQQRLVMVEKECKELQARIKELNDDTLESRERERDRLQAELVQRRARKDKAAVEIERLNGELETEEGKVKAAEETKQRIDASLAEQRFKINKLNESIADGNKEQLDLEETIRDIEQRNADLIEKQARCAALFTALNSALLSLRTEDAMFTAAENKGKLSIPESTDLQGIGMEINSAEDLKNWMGGIESRIEQLIKIYQVELQKVIEMSSTITASRDRPQ